MATTKGIRRDAFIKSVRPDPKSNEALVMLQGYIGDSDLEGHLRVYSDPALADFIELPERDICYAEPVSTDEDPLGGSRLWVKKTTVFTTGDPRHANRVKSTFLEGDIVRAFGGQGFVGQGPDITGDGTTLFPTCVSLGNGACTTNNRPCTDVGSLRVTCFRTCNCPPPPRSFGHGAFCPVSRNNSPCNNAYYAGTNVAGLGPFSDAICAPDDYNVLKPRPTILCSHQQVCATQFDNCYQPRPSIVQICPRPTLAHATCNWVQCSWVCDYVACRAGTLRLPTDWGTVVVNPANEQQFNMAAQQQFAAAPTYTGGFNPYQTANYGY
ncbi:MAG: hypothetical protein ACKVU0_10900 [Saprospiraceae bacterium]